jgi:hypothetical protein
VRIDQCVWAFRAVEVPVLACLICRCSEMSEVGRTLKFCDIQSHDFMQNYGYFVNVILLYLAVEC